jgi:Zn-dependent M32 family carboxypeptidase
MENVENVKNDPNIEPVEITSPITVERSKKPKKPKTTPLVKPEKKKEYDKRYRGKLAQTIATSAIEKYMETIKQEKQEAPTNEKEKQEAPTIEKDKQEFKELPQQLRPQINRDIDLSNYVSKDKYKKLKENFKNINHEVEEIKKSIHPIPKYNAQIYKALFGR